LHFVFLIFFGLVYFVFNIIFFGLEALTRSVFEYSFYKNYMMDLSSEETTLYAVTTVIFFLREFFSSNKVFVVTYNPFSSGGK
tara:strand:+ start:164 stop:412 length:249 start_codon:yes stop_codon:yes gene_type:complete